MSFHFKNNGFTLLECIFAIAAIALVVMLLLPSLGGTHRPAYRMTNNTQLRGIHQGLVTFAQSNKSGGHDGYYPGLDASGYVVPDGEQTGFSGDGTQPAARLWMMLEGNYFTPEYMIAPRDQETQEYVYPDSGQADPDNPLTSDHFSYALLGIAEAAAKTEDGFAEAADTRASEWSETLSTLAIIASDRAIGTGREDLSSVWTAAGSGEWKGGVVRNDNSTSYEVTAEFEETEYGDAEPNALDHLFEDAPGVSDALLVHEDATTAYSRD